MRKHQLKIFLLSDSDLVIQKRYGVWQLKKFMGKEFMGTVRSTFLIDKKGVVRNVWNTVKVKGHVQEVLQAAKAL